MSVYGYLTSLQAPTRSATHGLSVYRRDGPQLAQPRAKPPWPTAHKSRTRNEARLCGPKQAPLARLSVCLPMLQGHKLTSRLQATTKIPDSHSPGVATDHTSGNVSSCFPGMAGMLPSAARKLLQSTPLWCVCVCACFGVALEDEWLAVAVSNKDIFS
ncbi:hypothetical protein B0I35DRAFT_418563 [Stachybotrys elegans]|uniref:Uncharacterized protein n=1 Tax=Stachybotrys elegans TaxID=80388 RepID=A0A8K0WX42_9HYPO|nr:hypothetical protein B0I35DRAFT_418563 [Stachybotrys elegans]